MAGVRSSASVPSGPDPAEAELRRARGFLAQAELVTAPPGRFVAALAAAESFGTAVLRTRPRVRGGDVWRPLAAATPEFAEWAGFFAACGQRLHSRPDPAVIVTSREADDLVRDAVRFGEEVSRWIVRHRSSGRQRGTA